MDVLSKIISLKNEKINRKITPSHVLDVELYNAIIQDVKEELNKLYKEGKITVFKTLNNKGIDVM